MKGITNNTQSGRSMVEIIGVLAIMTIMTAGGFLLVRSAMATQKRNSVMDDVSKIVTGVRTLFADYDDLREMAERDGDTVMSAMGIDARSTGFPGVSYKLGVDTSDSSYQTFIVKVNGLPNRDCVVLSQKPWPDAIRSYSSCKTTKSSGTGKEGRILTNDTTDAFLSTDTLSLGTDKEGIYIYYKK